MKVSNCCGAPPLTETYENMGKCRKCKDDEEEVFRKCIKCEMMNTLGYLSEDKEKWICYSCISTYREMYNRLKKEGEQDEGNR